MAIRVNPELVEDLARYGAEDVQNCYHCGNCSAVCHHADEDFVFPRKSMRSLQMGLERKLESALEPWLCYYCGQCSEQCPREAEPGETMMSLRRWLTARYDFTGISRLFYRSWKAELAAILLLALLTGAGFAAFGFSRGQLAVYDGPGAFLPAHVVHIFDWIMAGVLSALLAVNSARMWWFTTGRRDDLPVPWFSYVKHLWVLPMHFMTQRRYAKCESRVPWAVHLLLVLSYLTLLVLIMFFLARMQSGPAIDWRAHAFGYAATAGLVGALVWASVGRVKKSAPRHKHSHESDWIFLAMLIFVVATGVAQHVLHRAGLDAAANILYVVHLMGVVPMLCLEVPFSKWSHLAYRTLAMYLAALHSDAMRVRRAVPAVPSVAYGG